MRRFLSGSLACCFLVAVVLPLSAHAQSDDLNEALGSIGSTYADNYTQPVTDALGAGMNAGLFRTAKVGGLGLVPGVDIYVGVSAMGAFTSGSADSFRLENDEIQANGRTLTIEYPNTDLPTAFGENESPGTAAVVDEETGQQVEEISLPPSLLNTSIAPLAIPQVGVGSIAGTDAQVRYLPETTISNYGSVSLTGLSVRHSISQYIPLSPVALAVQGTWQSLTVSGADQDGVVDAGGWALNAQVSKSVPVAPVTFYGGLQYEQFGVDVDYTFRSNAGTSEVELDQDAANNVRALAGVSFTLAIFQLNVDYALSNNNTVSAGLGVAL
ncbi:MAG: DUF6588 family protein [Salinivenus sp.]